MPAGHMHMSLSSFAAYGTAASLGAIKPLESGPEVQNLNFPGAGARGFNPGGQPSGTLGAVDQSINAYLLIATSRPSYL